MTRSRPSGRIAAPVMVAGAVVLAAVGTWLLVSPDGGGEDPVVAGTSAPTSTTASSSGPATTPATPQPSENTPADVVDDEAPVQDEPTTSVIAPPPAAASATDLASASAAAAAFMEAWLTTSPAESWWDRVGPLMTEQAGSVYFNVDPAEIPAAQQVIEDSSAAVGEPSELFCAVDVDTTAGTYQVTLTRDDSVDPWLVERLTQPPGTP